MSCNQSKKPDRALSLRIREWLDNHLRFISSICFAVVVLIFVFFLIPSPWNIISATIGAGFILGCLVVSIYAFIREAKELFPNPDNKIKANIIGAIILAVSIGFYIFGCAAVAIAIRQAKSEAQLVLKQSKP